MIIGTVLGARGTQIVRGHKIGISTQHGQECRRGQAGLNSGDAALTTALQRVTESLSTWIPRLPERSANINAIPTFVLWPSNFRSEPQAPTATARLVTWSLNAPGRGCEQLQFGARGLWRRRWTAACACRETSSVPSRKCLYQTLPLWRAVLCRAQELVMRGCCLNENTYSSAVTCKVISYDTSKIFSVETQK